MTTVNVNNGYATVDGVRCFVLYTENNPHGFADNPYGPADVPEGWKPRPEQL